MPNKKPGSVFGSTLAEYRNAVIPRLSQDRLARKSGFDHSYISRLEAGQRMPTRDAIIRLAAALGIPENDKRFDALLFAAGFHVANEASLFRSATLYALETAYRTADEATRAEIDSAARFVLEAVVERRRKAAAKAAVKSA